MKRTTKLLTLVLALCMVVAAFSGCAREKAPDPVENAKLMEFPGLHWFDSPETVKETLGITTGDMEDLTEPEAFSYSILWKPENFRLFDQRVHSIIFRFHDYQEEGNYRLCTVTVHYPDDADMDGVRKNITRYYGEPAERYTELDVAGQIAAKTVEVSENGTAWPAATTMAEQMTQEEIDRMCDVLARFEDWTVTREEVEAALNDSVAADITLNTNAYWGMDPRPEDLTKNVVAFDALLLMSCKYWYIGK